MSQCFIMESATEDILNRVTNMCAICYDDLHVGDTIHYDVQNYRYVCQKCQEELCEQLDSQCEITEDEEGGLFC